MEKVDTSPKSFGLDHSPNRAIDEIDLMYFWLCIWRQKLAIVIIVMLSAVASIFYAKSIPNIYQAYALLSPSHEAKGGGVSALAKNFGGFASLAGLNLSNGGNMEVATALETIRSRRFAVALIEKYELLVPLMAAKGWDKSENKLVLDEQLYDETSGQWVRETDDPSKVVPSMWEAYIAFSGLLSVSQDNKSGFVTITFEHYSPYFARELVDIIVNEINLVMKLKDVSEAQTSINYLTKQIESTSIVDMKEVFYQLIEEQSKTMMLAEVRDEYIFSTIDPAVVAEQKIRPKRALICIVGVFAGGMLSILFALLVGGLRKTG